MACPHGKPRGRCDICRMERQEEWFGVPADHMDDEASQKKASRDGGGEA